MQRWSTRVANLALLKPDFEILAVFEHLGFGFFWRSKKPVSVGKGWL